MSPEPAQGARPRRILVIANETCASIGMIEEVRYRAGQDAEVVVVAPALARSRLEHWLSSGAETRQAAAEERLQASLSAFEEVGLRARGQLGDADPLQALDDALRECAPDEVVISTHPHDRSNWLERHVVRRARERYRLPIHHVVVDIERELTQADDDRRARGSWGPEDRESRLRVYHASPYEEALAIRERGFRDRSADADEIGVWVSNRPPAEAGGADEAVLFAVDVPERVVAGFERSAGEPGERRFLVPADLLNRLGPPVAVDDWSE